MAVTSESFGLLMHLTAHDWRTALDRRLRPLGLSRATWLLLAIVSRSEGLSQSELASRLGLEGASVVRLVDRLEREGLVERHTGEDRRVKTIHLRDKGAGVAAEIRKVAAALRGDVFRGIRASELEAAAAVLAKLKARLGAVQ
ncbi:MAG: MarR family transcriptional regulator [Burkholderiales bacterium]